MKIENLSVRCFRNMKRLDFVPHENINIIYGDNAQGKTNLIEALWLFTGARSFRSSRDIDYISFGEETTSLDLSFSCENRSQTASIFLGSEKKSVLLNEIKQDSISSLSGIFQAVVFSPDHLLLVKQGPENRRRMIDISLHQTYPKYGKALEGYSKALRQRNSLLKDVYYHPSLIDTLDAWDKTLVDYGAYITAMRAGYIKKLSGFSSEIYAGISGEKEKLTISYVPSFGGDISGFSRQDFHDALEKALARGRQDDIRNAVTGTGPQRDDMEISIGGKSARIYASQGQQRSIILALKLAECGILEERNGESSVIMLDDVMSELDEHRREYLLRCLEGKQVIITCCDASAFSALKSGKVFHMEHGEITKQSVKRRRKSS